MKRIARHSLLKQNFFGCIENGLIAIGQRIHTLVCFRQFEPNPGSNSEEEEEEEDVDAALKKEVAQLKASGAKQERRFQALESGANNVIFIKTHNLG